MKKIFWLLSMVLILFACGQKGEYKIQGTVTGESLDGKSIYFSKFNANGVEKSDTVVIKDGKFEFHGVQETPAIYYVSMTEGGSEITQGVPLLVQAGKLFVKIEGDKVEVGGNPETETYQKMMDTQRPLVEKMQSFDQKYKDAVNNSTMTPEMQANLEKEVQAVYDQIHQVAAQYILNNINNLMGEEVFLTHMQILTPEEREQALSKASDSFKSTPEVKLILEGIEAEKSVGVGKQFTDFILPDAQGKEVAFSSYAGKGKFVLLDFWASWCGPCVKEMPTLVKAYQFYKSKNFEIVGVSLDEDKDAWLNAVKNLNITWPQLSDLKGCATASKPYMVQSIPHTILIDPQGIIIAKDLRGDALIAKLEEVIK